MTIEGLSPESNDALVSKEQPGSVDPSSLNREMADKVTYIRQQAPWLSPGTILSLAKAHASSEAIELAGYMQGIKATEEPPPGQESDIPGWLSKTGSVVIRAGSFGWNVFKKPWSLLAPDMAQPVLSSATDVAFAGLQKTRPVTRWVTGAALAVPEAIQYFGARASEQLGADIVLEPDYAGGFWDVLTVTHMIRNFENQGDGYLPSNQAIMARQRAERAHRGMLNGQVFTIGRGAANLVSTPGTESYKTVSGLIDGIITVKSFDPTKLVKPALRGVRNAAGVVPLLKRSYGSEDVRNFLLQQAGASTTGPLGPTVDLEAFVNFAKTNPLMKRKIRQLVKDTDESSIFFNHFNGQISTDNAVALAAAKSEDEVIAALVPAYTMGPDVLAPRHVTTLTTFGNIRQGRIMRRSRLMTPLEDEFMVITGDPEDNRKAVLSAVALMRMNGVAHKDVMATATQWIRTLRQNASRVDINKTYEIQRDLISKTLKANGHSQIAIDEIWTKTRERFDIIRNYFMDRQGVDTDGGFLHLLLQQDGIDDAIGANVKNQLLNRLASAGGGAGDTIAFDGAIQLMDLQNRIILLPNFREIRRITRNPLFRKLLPDLTNDAGGLKTKVFKKRAIFSKKRGVESNPSKYHQVEWENLTEDIKNLEHEVLALSHSGTSAPDVLADKRKLLGKLKDKEKSMLKAQRVMMGDQRLPVVFLDIIQNVLWKNLVLLTGGYMMRNTIDGQTRMLLSGIGKTSHLRPRAIDYISLVIGRRNKVDIMGDSILARGWGNNPEAEINRMARELGDRLRGGARRLGMPDSTRGSHRAKLGSWNKVTRGIAGSGLTLHTDGVLQQIERLSSRIEHREFARFTIRNMARRTTRDTRVNQIVDMLFDPRFRTSDDTALDSLSEIKKLFKDGLEFVETGTGKKFKIPPIDLDGMEEILARNYVSLYVDKIIKGGFDTHTGNVPALQFIVAYGDIPVVNDLGTLNIQEFAINEVWEFPNKTGVIDRFRQGGLVYDTHNTPHRVVAINKNRKTARLAEIERSNALKTPQGRQAIRRVISSTPVYGSGGAQVGVPMFVAREMTGAPEEGTGLFAKAEKYSEQATRWFFGVLNEKSTRSLERSPTFRHYYYEIVMEHADDLSDAAARRILAQLENKALEAGVTVEKFVGNKQLIKKLNDLFEPKTIRKGAVLNEKHLDEYAKAVALKKMEELLFDASKTNNLKDILRIIIPFGNAWNEVVGHYLSASMTDGIHMYRATQRTITGLSGADPDNDGRGFIYNDPGTGDLMFTFPFSQPISRLITGGQYSAGLTAPVKRLSQGINVLPAIGPVAQVAVSQIPVTPSNREIIEFLLPYGEPSGTGLGAAIPLPGWAVKLGEALQADTHKNNTIFRNTYDEVLRAEHATGMYDVSFPGEWERLKVVAKKKARMLTAMRALSQFIGPTSGSTDFKVPTEVGDQYAKVLIKEFHELQQEDYDTAVLRFLNLYGQSALMYLASKSEAVMEGLESSRDFGDWEQQNAALISEYPRVSNYFGPSFGDFDFMTLTRQTDEGKRRPLSDDEQIRLANLRVGSARYRSAKLRLGSDLSEEDKDRLADYRVFLSQKYPGFPPRAEFITNQYLNDMEELKIIVRDPRIQWNPALQSVILYLRQRQELLNKADVKTFKSKKMAGDREYLFIYGSRLAERDMYFQRIWQRFLAEEVED